MVAVVLPTDPLAARHSIQLRELEHRPLITMPRGSGVRAALDAVCIAAGIHLDVGLEASSPDAIAMLVRSGLGVGIAMESLATMSMGEFCSVQLQKKPSGRLELAWRSGERVSPAARALIAVAQHSEPEPDRIAS